MAGHSGCGTSARSGSQDGGRYINPPPNPRTPVWSGGEGGSPLCRPRRRRGPRGRSAAEGRPRDPQAPLQALRQGPPLTRIAPPRARPDPLTPPHGHVALALRPLRPPPPQYRTSGRIPRGFGATPASRPRLHRPFVRRIRPRRPFLPVLTGFDGRIPVWYRCSGGVFMRGPVALGVPPPRAPGPLLPCAPPPLAAGVSMAM